MVFYLILYARMPFTAELEYPAANDEPEPEKPRNANKSGMDSSSTKRRRCSTKKSDEMADNAQASRGRSSKFDLRCQEQEEERLYHFVTFVPHAGSVWELDGLQLNPQELTPPIDSENWVSIASNHLRQRMEKYATLISNSILFLSKGCLLTFIISCVID